MSQGPLLDTNSPLSADQAQRLNEVLQSLDSHQMTWLSGYLAGFSASGQPAATGAPASAETTASAPEVVVLFGSQTGNAEGVAELARDRAKARGFEVRFADMADFGKKDLKEPINLMVVVSTHGEGEPPDPAIGFHELLGGRKAPKLEGSRFTVLGLGDSSYDQFCQMGKDFDARFAELGAERILDRVDCDVDYEEAAEAWVEDALSKFAELAGGTTTAAPQAEAAADSGRSKWSKRNPFHAEVLDTVLLNDHGSSKETRHVELSLEDSGLVYEPGDAVGILPQNDPEHVDELIATLGLDAASDVGEGRQLRDALLSDFEITTLTRPFVEKWAELSDNAELRRLLGEDARQEFREWSYGRHIIDVIEQFPAEQLDAATFTGTLRKLPPRLYSIASSYNADPDEVHLTIGVVRYESLGRARNGVTTGYLADHVEPGDRIPIYIDHNKNFKLPHDDNTPIIMVGPGTGVAPFRAFMQEREERGARGSNWLFFGDQHFRTDFLYQSEWLDWREKGLLHRLEVAFSRDQGEKIYVQDRMREHGEEIYAWLEAGAHFYVCGDGERMAADVHQALLDIVQQYGDLDEEAAAQHVRELQQSRRYQRDVY
ncbi:sulfite reductase (NADPH) alpha subunit [Kushneria sinocarnis]|uniref:Sulfite reductase [NADPH] flavoprotein alpha-component n=1 Tax=Kushneria sinocarnis TaxID=595502 RepID=A0A420WUT1_9GAMM|nr:assimilatory sulfite reductase (NADPH) flavoprotein subunit [Kushneria sinocarnis]RKQ97198.1 sulfite reductase (NADPH) alpha subunit [Kushneria sinocarnis]